MAKDLLKDKIIIYKTQKGPELEVRLEKETVWLTQKQIAELFDKGLPTINEHIKNVYKENELDEKLTIRKSRIVRSEGRRRIKREVELYNLDKNNYLYRESGERKINDNALVALALLIAVSDPREKDIMIRIITNILN